MYWPWPEKQVPASWITIKREKKYSTQRHSWGIFRLKNQKYSCIVVIHRPDKQLGYYGSTVAAPVFKKIAKKIHNNLPKTINIHPDQIKNLSSKAVNVVSSDGDSQLKRVNPNGGNIGLEPMGLKVVIKGKGKVKKQSIKAGMRYRNNQTIVLELS